MAYLSGFSTYLGNKVLLQDMDEFSKTKEFISEFVIDGGLKYFRKSELEPFELASNSVLSFLEEWDIDAKEIDTIVYATSSLWLRKFSERASISKFLENAGLSNRIPLCVFGHGCANFHIAIKVATSLVESGRSNNVLVVTTDVSGSQPRRVVEPALTVASDGAACAMVSNKYQLGTSYTIGEIAIEYSSKLGEIDPKESRTEYFACVAEGIRKAVKLSLSKSKLAKSDIKLVIPNNYKIPVLKMFAAICGLDEGKLYLECVENYAHCFASDPIIALKKIVFDSIGTKHLVLATGTQSWASMILHQES